MRITLIPLLLLLAIHSQPSPAQPSQSAENVFLITLDGLRWTDHEAGLEGAEQIWIALLGPGVTPQGEARNATALGQDQIAATESALLGLDYAATGPVGPSLMDP